MRKLIVQQFVTLNNIAVEQDGNMSFVGGYSSDWADMYDRAFCLEALRFMDEIDTMVLGAHTYEMFAGGWPQASKEDKIANRINALHKYVASHSLTEAPWGDFAPATVMSDPVKTIEKLKQSDGKAIVLWGSFTLLRSLVEAKLVDEYYLRVCPATRSQGTTLFMGDETLKLIEAKSYDKDIVTLRYATPSSSARQHG